jgi:hypothetical protein
MVATTNHMVPAWWRGTPSVGDPITVSSEDRGIKATGSGMIVGTALEPYTAAAPRSSGGPSHPPATESDGVNA